MAGDHRDDRPGRLADDGGARPRGRAVLRRHLLPGPAAAGPAGVPAGARGALGRLDEPPRRGRPRSPRTCPSTCARTVALAGEEPLDADLLAGAVALAGRRLRRARTAASAAPRSSRRRWCWSSCSGTPPGPARRTPPGWPTRPCGRWPAAASTTSSPAASRATRVDRGWVVPHFEKMLYDNAQLLGVYARWWRQTGDPLGERVARQTADFLLAELRTDEGGFASALDADTEGVEGRFYVWTPGRARRGARRRRRRLGRARCSRSPRPAPSSTARPRSSCSPTPTTRSAGSRSAPGCSRPGRPGPARPATTRWWRPGTGSRSPRWPRRACCCGEQRYVDAAVDAAPAARRPAPRRTARCAGSPATASSAGTPGCSRTTPASRTALLALLSATGDVTWLWTARHPARRRAGDVRGRRRRLLRHRARTPSGCVSRPRDPSDNASPSGQSALVHALLGLRRRDRLGSAPRRGRGARCATSARWPSGCPRFAGWSLAAAEAALAGPLEVAVVGDRPATRGRDELAPGARRRVVRRAPGLVVVVVGEPSDAGRPGETDDPRDGAAARRPRASVDGRALRRTSAAGWSCDRPGHRRTADLGGAAAPR